MIQSRSMILAKLPEKVRLILPFVFTLLIFISLTGSLFAQSLKPSPPMAEGPYWKTGSPKRAVLYQQRDTGKRIEVSGKVLDISEKAIPGTKIDIWQTDGKGAYDNSGFRFRGHVFTDDSGTYSFKTVLPGEYPGRTPHIHIKLTSPNGRRLTTQLYFPEYDSRNRSDWLYDENLVVKWRSSSQASFNFVLKTWN